MQELIDSMNEQSRLTRGKYQLTLGGLIDKLKDCTSTKRVIYLTGGAPCSPDSYRGYYSDLAFDTTCEDVTVESLLKLAQECVGKVFEGYKGGDYKMSEDTPLWIDSYGSYNSVAMMDVDENTLEVVILLKRIE